MSALVMLGELRAVGAFVTYVAGLHCALPSIAALRAVGRVLRRFILSEMEVVRRKDSIHKTACSSVPRRALLFCAPQLCSEERVVFRRTKSVLMQYL